ncbi:Uncharacterized protein BM_BM530 [Brugia malayi]|uniref:Bm530 n=1 Tax=Brugia malayi TaxID=6279 RepID=A0A1U7F1D5_BRUMA|nr:Uncharacterized protein BM_BM530 [Brugia malayi]CDP97326.1 Bm530 [Brugia malayi]VIO92864.1 Uncharacterized protein BM_BM530 [Brugia malayi]
MRLLNTFFKKESEKGYGRTTFIVSLFFAMFSTVFMVWSEEEQRKRRQAAVKEYVRKFQQ